jgi:FlaA1/EpsC-like NDP-sugar epimerase
MGRAGQTPLQIVVADVGDWRKMEWVFQQFKPQVVFHAAAYKHVPMLESHPEEALRVNIMGTIIVSELSREYEAERFVFISTDKAVKPSCVMGASKRIGELWIRGLSDRSSTVLTSVRFGNVFGSRGSVVPTFARQIEIGGPLTITHPEMHRFFMSIPEAASLVLQAAAFAQSDEVFMLDMGEEISILELAQRMIRLKGLRINKDIKVEYIGVRPGEKLREDLAYDQESQESTLHPCIYRLQAPSGPVSREILLGMIADLIHSNGRSDGKRVVREGILRMASHEIEDLQDRPPGQRLAKGWRRLADGFYGVSDETQAEERLAKTLGASRATHGVTSIPGT